MLNTELSVKLDIFTFKFLLHLKKGGIDLNYSKPEEQVER